MENYGKKLWERYNSKDLRSSLAIWKSLTGRLEGNNSKIVVFSYDDAINYIERQYVIVPKFRNANEYYAILIGSLFKLKATSKFTWYISLDEAMYINPNDTINNMASYFTWIWDNSPLYKEFRITLALKAHKNPPIQILFYELGTDPVNDWWQVLFEQTGLVANNMFNSSQFTSPVALYSNAGHTIYINYWALLGGVDCNPEINIAYFGYPQKILQVMLLEPDNLTQRIWTRELTEIWKAKVNLDDQLLIDNTSVEQYIQDKEEERQEEIDLSYSEKMWQADSEIYTAYHSDMGFKIPNGFLIDSYHTTQVNRIHQFRNVLICDRTQASHGWEDIDEIPILGGISRPLSKLINGKWLFDKKSRQAFDRHDFDDLFNFTSIDYFDINEWAAQKHVSWFSIEAMNTRMKGIRLMIPHLTAKQMVQIWWDGKNGVAYKIEEVETRESF